MVRDENLDRRLSFVGPCRPGTGSPDYCQNNTGSAVHDILPVHMHVSDEGKPRPAVDMEQLQKETLETVKRSSVEWFLPPCVLRPTLPLRCRDSRTGDNGCAIPRSIFPGHTIDGT